MNMKAKLLTTLILVLIFTQVVFSQNMIKGATKILSYKNGAVKDAQMKLSNGDNLLIGFRTYFVDVKVLKGSEGQTILSVEESNEWENMQACEFDFEKDGKNEIVVVYGDGFSYMQVCVFKLTGSTYKKIGDFEGQNVCELSNGKIILPFGSQGLFSEYSLINGKFVQTN